MASLIPRTYKGKVTYYVRYFVDKKAHHISTQTGNKREALRIKEKVEEELRKKKFGLTERTLSLAALFEQRLEWLAVNNRPETSIRHNQVVYKTFLSAMGDEAIDARVVDRYKAVRMGQVTPQTLNTELRTIKAALNWGARYGYCEAVKIEFVKEPARLPVFLSEAEIEAVRRVIGEGPWRLLFETYLYTGGRRMEVLGLTWADVDLDRKRILFRDTKSNRWREVGIHPSLLARVKNIGDRTGYLFQWREGRMVNRQMLAFFTEAGLPVAKRKIHVLRHSFASHLVMRGANLVAVQKLLGHASIEMTMRYSHLTPEHLDKVLELLP